MLVRLIAHKKAIVKELLSYGFLMIQIRLEIILYSRSAHASVQLILLTQRRLP